MGYDLLVRAILEDKTTIDMSTLPEDQKKQFDEAAKDLRDRGFFLDAAKIFSMTKNKEQLVMLAKYCLKEKNLAVAFFAFDAVKEREGLNATGEAYLQVPEVESALKCFEAAGNGMMVQFIRENF